MFIHLPPSLHVAIYNLINLHLFPQQGLRLNQFDTDERDGADIVWQRVGNPFGFGRYAHTYHYRISGDGFDLQLLAIWADEDTATAQVEVVAITPDDELAREALQDWLTRTVTGRRPPREPFDHLGLN